MHVWKIAHCFLPILRHHFQEERKLFHQEFQGISFIHPLITRSLADLCVCVFTSVFTDLIVVCQLMEDDVIHVCDEKEKLMINVAARFVRLIKMYNYTVQYAFGYSMWAATLHGAGSVYKQVNKPLIVICIA